MAKKSTAKSAEIVDVKLETEIVMPTNADDALLGDLLEQLEAADPTDLTAADELLEAVDEITGAIDAAAGVAVGDEQLLADIVEAVETAQATKALYADQPAPTVEGDAPETTVEDMNVSKGKKAKAPKEPKVPKEPKEPKAARPTSVTHKPGDLLKIKLGEKALDYLIFNGADATLDQAGLEAKAQAFIDRMNDKEAIADKVKDKIQMMLVWLMKGGELNEVLKRAITVLDKDGQLTSGDKGNMQLNLLAKPYSLGTARSQSNQVFMAFPELGLTLKEKGRMIPNPDSTLLPIAKQMLGL